MIGYTEEVQFTWLFPKRTSFGDWTLQRNNIVSYKIKFFLKKTPQKFKWNRPSYISFFWFNIVGGEKARAVSYAASPPLSFSFWHKDGVSLGEGQISRFRAFIGIESHIFYIKK